MHRPLQTAPWILAHALLECDSRIRNDEAQGVASVLGILLDERERAPRIARGDLLRPIRPPRPPSMHIDLLRWTRYATYVYLVAVPGVVESLPLLGMHDNARALQALLCCLAVAAWALHLDPSSYRTNPIQITLVGLALTLTVMSVWQAQWPLFAATEACLWGGLIALVWVFAKSPLDELAQELPSVIAVAILLMGLQELMDIGFAWLSSHPLDVGAVGRGHPNRRHFNHVQTMALVMAILPIWYGQARWIRWSAWFGLAVGLALVWFTGARSTLLAISVVSVGALVFASQNRVLWLKRILLTCALGLVAYQFFYILLPELLGIEMLLGHSITERANVGSIQNRLTHWKLALGMALERPLAGWGGLHYATQHHADAAHPHNIILQWAAEWGWVTTALALIALAWWTRLLWRAMWQLPSSLEWPYPPLITTAWLAALAGWIDAMFSGTLTMPVSQVWWCISVGLIFYQDRTSQSHPNAIPKRALIILLFLIVFCTTIALSYATSSQASQSQIGNSLTTTPRLWLFGFI